MANCQEEGKKIKCQINVFLIVVVIYIIFVIAYNLTYRKNITYQNIVINKKRIVFTLVLITIFTYSFMQRDFWVLQPLINSMPNIATKNNTITYNDENGVLQL